MINIPVFNHDFDKIDTPYSCPKCNLDVGMKAEGSRPFLTSAEKDTLNSMAKSHIYWLLHHNMANAEVEIR